MAWQPDYVTLVEGKSYLKVEDSADDAFLAVWITTASRAVDTFCHRQFGKVAAPEARQYEAVWDRHIRSWVTDIDDLQTTTGLTVLDSAATPQTDYSFTPVNALQKGKPYERILTSTGGTLTITASWGWTAVPVAVKNATLLQMARFVARRDSPFGVAGSPSEGSEQRLLTASLDPDLKTSLGSTYRREWWAA